MRRSPRWLVCSAVLAAVAVATTWLFLAGGRDVLAYAARLDTLAAIELAVLTVGCLLLRFFRWQYLLRRAGVRVPVRPSLGFYLASLTGMATPAYVGETIRCVLLRQSFNVPLRRTLPLWVAERVLDFAAIATWVAMARWNSSPAIWATLLVAAAVIALFQVVRGRSAFGRVSPVPVGFALSLLAWLPAMFSFSVAGAGLDLPIGTAESFTIFGLSTIGGGVSLMPAGIGTMGGLSILQVRAAGVGLAESVAVVTVVRIATVGFTLAIGAAFLLTQLVRGRPFAPGRSFDVIADEYLDQFSPHIWSLLLERKTARIRDALGAPDPDRVGLDLGCGLGRQADVLRRLGYRVIGLDPAHRLLRQATMLGVPACAGAAVSLPFADQSLDFVYTVGVLHHLPDHRAQDDACREIRRVLKPDGLFLVLETNPRNPLFRLYMSYLFPLLRSIDQGTEIWLDDDRWRRIAGFRLATVKHFTFLPDFLPRWLLRAALPIERALERSFVGRFSVHYMAVLRRIPTEGLEQQRRKAGGGASPSVKRPQ